jgi:hypothetical protein
MSDMTDTEVKSILPDEPFQVFICYAHADNESENREQRWLDRFLEFMGPLERQALISPWSDRKLEIGDSWHANIQARLGRSKAVILLVSPAFLNSRYVSTNELPVILSQAKARNLLVVPILISPSLFEHVEYKYPDAKKGPKTFKLASLQSANPPTKTLFDMSTPEQNRVFLDVAERLLEVLKPSETAPQVETSPTKPKGEYPAVLLAQFQEFNGEIRKSSRKDTPQLYVNLWIEQAPTETTTVTFEIDDMSFKNDRIWTKERGRGAREFFTEMDTYGDVDIWVRGDLEDGGIWRIKSSLYGALKRHYGSRDKRPAVKQALEQIKTN